MAITTCRECQGTVSDQADTCPTCGVQAPTEAALRRQDKRQDRRWNWIMGLVALLIIASIAGLITYRHHEAQKKEQQQVCDFREALGSPC